MDISYFAWVREQIGTGHEQVEPPVSVGTVMELVAWLSERSERHAAAFADVSRIRAAVDDRFVPLHASLAGAREVALFPPVTGG